MNHAALDRVVRRALDSLPRPESQAVAGPRELISLFAFQHLLPVGATSRPVPTNNSIRAKRAPLCVLPASRSEG